MQKRTLEELILEKGDLATLYQEDRKPVCLILEDIRSVYNVGAIFRTADAAKIEKLYLCGITAYPPRPDLEKTALRTTEFVPWEYHRDVHFVIADLKQSGYSIVALEQTDQSINFQEYIYQKPIAIVLGNEVEGIREKTLSLCDAAIEIPMQGIANSLNVSTAAGIVLFQAIK